MRMKDNLNIQKINFIDLNNSSYARTDCILNYQKHISRQM